MRKPKQNKPSEMKHKIHREKYISRKRSNNNNNNNNSQNHKALHCTWRRGWRLGQPLPQSPLEDENADKRRRKIKKTLLWYPRSRERIATKKTDIENS
jgi:hypothetical protein